MLEKQTKPRSPLSPVIIGATLGALATGLIGNSSAPVERSSVPQHTVEKEAGSIALRQEAEIAALRYNCSLTEVTNTGNPVEKPYADGYPRSEVRVSVDLRNKPGVEPVLEKYKDDDTIKWFAPYVGLSVNGENGKRIYVQAQDRFTQPVPSDPGLVGTISGVSLFPKTTYADGTTADVFVAHEVDYSDNNAITTLTGVMPCGTLEYHDGQWAATTPSDREPYIKHD